MWLRLSYRVAELLADIMTACFYWPLWVRLGGGMWGREKRQWWIEEKEQIGKGVVKTEKANEKWVLRNWLETETQEEEGGGGAQYLWVELVHPQSQPRCAGASRLPDWWSAMQLSPLPPWRKRCSRDVRARQHKTQLLKHRFPEARRKMYSAVHPGQTDW